MQKASNPTRAWAIGCAKQMVDDNDDPAFLDATLELIAGLMPSVVENKNKNDVGWAVLKYIYDKTEDSELSCRRYLGAA